MKNKIKCKKTIVLLIIILIIGVGVYPTIAINSEVDEKKIKSNYQFDENPKEYLFQTIIDILKQPEFESVIDGTVYLSDILDFNNYDKEVSKNIFEKKPIIFISILLSKPEFKFSYLEKQYNNGNEILEILNKEKTNLFIQSIEIKNNKFFDNLDNLIENNDYLYDRIINLQQLNKKIDGNSSILCDILQILLIGYLIRTGFIGFIGEIFEGSLISKIFDFLWFKNWELAGVCLFIYDLFDCDISN